MTMYSVQQVATMFGCKTATVRKAIHEGRVQAQKIGFSYIIMQEELERLQKRGHFRFKDDRGALVKPAQAEGIVEDNQEQVNG